MWRRLLYLSGIALSLRAQSDDPKDLLRRVASRVLETVDRLPRYVCTQTIDRAEYQRGDKLSVPRSCDHGPAERKAQSSQRRLSSTDRLRIDVASGLSRESFGVTDEMYSWTGANRFDDLGISNLVRQGAISTGSFSSFLKTIFAGSTANFTYNGDTTVDGRPMVEFGFNFPAEKSTMVYFYRLGAEKGHSETAAYNGTLLVDPNTLDLVRLTVHISPPPQTGACEATQVLDYNRVALNGSDFLLTREAHLEILHLNGTEMENRIVYSACHEFLGESTLKFEAPDGSQTGSPDASVTRALALPEGLPFKVAFQDRIDAGAASAGDLITARLKTPIRDRSGQIFVPEGSQVTGRILRAKHSYGRERTFELAVRLEAVNIGGVSRPIHVAPDSGARRFASGGIGPAPRVNLGTMDFSQDREIAVFEFNENRRDFAVPKDYESSWLTLGR